MEVALGLLKIMAGRYRQLLDGYADLSFLTVENRVAKMIYQLSAGGQAPINRRENPINELAAHIACAPEAISRSLTVLKCREIISTNRTTITVLNPDELAKMAQVDSKNIFAFGHKF